MRDLHDAASAVWGTLRGADVPRRYLDPAGEYAAATGGLAVRDRSHRLRLRFDGRQPGAMLTGVITGRMPAALERPVQEVVAGRAEPSAVLTPKARFVAELRLWRADAQSETFVADVPRAAAPSLLEHLGRYLPPRFVTTHDVTDETGMLTVLGPEAAAWLSREVLGLRVGSEELDALGEGDLRAAGDVTVIRSGGVATQAFDVVAERPVTRALWQRLMDGGAAPVGSGVWEALRLEAGRPAFGDDMDADTLMPETGLVGRLVDHGKGCYTGQEVVVRIRDRGQVNRLLRRFRVDEGPTPAPGAEVWHADHDKALGVVTSVAESPRMGTLALGYLRREVEPGGEVRIGSPEGSRAKVEAL